jgi:hypothetical protein
MPPIFFRKIREAAEATHVVAGAIHEDAAIAMKGSRLTDGDHIGSTCPA